MSPMTELSGKRAFVTGGTCGIGVAIILALAEHGADVVFSHKLSSGDCVAEIITRIESLGRRGYAVETHGSDPAEVRRIVVDAVARLGGLDILVHNAGAALAASLRDLSPDVVDERLRTSFRDAVLTAQAAIPHMTAGGRIVTIGTDMNEDKSDHLSALQIAMDAAHQGFTKGLARELASRDITVNLIQPGLIDMEPEVDPTARSARRLVKNVSSRTIEELAAVVAFVAGSDSALMTGSIITAHGSAND